MSADSACCHFQANGDRVSPSGDHESKYREEVIGPGRQDWFFEPLILFQERHLICGTAHFPFSFRPEEIHAAASRLREHEQVLPRQVIVDP